MKALKPKWYAF